MAQHLTKCVIRSADKEDIFVIFAQRHCLNIDVMCNSEIKIAEE
jgi:hypothetical protein